MSTDCCLYHRHVETEGYRIGEKKSVAEYAQLDANDESLARWKASLGITSDAAGPSTGMPKVRRKVSRKLCTLAMLTRPLFECPYS